MDYKGYPAITHGDETIFGEIMIINEADYESTMKAMDKMEGFISESNPENEYHKVILEVENLHTNEIIKNYPLKREDSFFITLKPILCFNKINFKIEIKGIIL